MKTSRAGFRRHVVQPKPRVTNPQLNDYLGIKDIPGTFLISACLTGLLEVLVAPGTLLKDFGERKGFKRNKERDSWRPLRASAELCKREASK